MKLVHIQFPSTIELIDMHYQVRQSRFLKLVGVQRTPGPSASYVIALSLQKTN